VPGAVCDALLTLPRSMQSKVFKTVGCPSVPLSVCLSHRSTAAAAGFAAERASAADIDQFAGTPAACAQQQMLAASCLEPRDEARQRFVVKCFSGCCRGR